MFILKGNENILLRITVETGDSEMRILIKSPLMIPHEETDSVRILPREGHLLHPVTHDRL